MPDAAVLKGSTRLQVLQLVPYLTGDVHLSLASMLLHVSFTRLPGPVDGMHFLMQVKHGRVSDSNTLT